MKLEGKYRRIRTDMEDMIEAHQENVKIWQYIKAYYDRIGHSVPNIDLPTIIKLLLPDIP